jgi:hypothetical protein
VARTNGLGPGKICVTFIIPWEVWPENFSNARSLQRHGTNTIPLAYAMYDATSGYAFCAPSEGDADKGKFWDQN